MAASWGRAGPTPLGWLPSGGTFVGKVRRHWVSVLSELLVSSVFVVPVLFIAGTAELLVGHQSALVATATSALLVCLWGVGIAARWRAVSLTLTTRNLVLGSGVFHRVRIEMALDTVQEIASMESLVGRLLRYGTLEVQLFGSSAQNFGPVRDPQLLRNLISRLRLQSGLWSNMEIHPWPWGDRLIASRESEDWKSYAAAAGSDDMLAGYLTVRIQGQLYLVTSQTAVERVVGRINNPDPRIRIRVTSGQQAGKEIVARTILLVGQVPPYWREVLRDNARFIP